jgi:L-asparaginase/Glu-tRNA(Gln) amidotransferase subunit D
LASVAKKLEEIEMDILTKEQQFEMVKQIPTLKKLNSIAIVDIPNVISTKEAIESWEKIGV